MECRIVSLDDQTWRIEEFDAKDSVYLYLLAGGRSALLNFFWRTEDRTSER